jgi:hypothetical protein
VKLAGNVYRNAYGNPPLTKPRTIPGGTLLDRSRRIDPALIRFSQASVGARFSRGGGTIEELANGLRNGVIPPDAIPPIRLVERGGVLFSLDNRRLEALARAGVNVPFRMATPEEAAAESCKFTSRYGGMSVRIREA